MLQLCSRGESGKRPLALVLVRVSVVVRRPVAEAALIKKAFNGGLV